MTKHFDLNSEIDEKIASFSKDGWCSIKLKHIAEIKNGNSLNDELKEKYKSTNQDDLPYIGSKDIDVNTRKIDFQNGIRIPKIDASTSFKIAKSNSSLICIEGGSAGKKIAFTEQEVCFVNKIASISTGNKFIYYVLQSELFQNQFNSNLSGLISGVSIGNLKNMVALIPESENIQLKVVKYLDSKIYQIHALIKRKEQIITLLKEERFAVINQSISQGLNPSVRTKNIDNAWIGKVPIHWQEKKLRYVGNCQNGISAGAEYFGSGSPFVSYSDVYNNEELPTVVEGLANSSQKEQIHYSVLEGDVFFTRTSETIEEIGIASACMNTISNAVFAGFLIRFRPFEGMLDKRFSKFYFQSFVPRVFFVKEMNLVTRASLSQELLKRLPILLPPIEEQKEIADFLDERTKKIDTTIEKSEKEIEFLKEYKNALISEVVTGKIDVSTEQIN